MYKREEIVNGQKVKLLLRDDVDESIVNEIFKFKEYRRAGEIIQDVGGVILDVGAHAGYFALWAIAQNSEAKIFCLEPIKANFDFLKENIKENKAKNIKAENVALYKETGQVSIFLSEDSHNHSLLPISENKEIVKAVSFADFVKKNKIKNISLLKMDIEGGEYEIFQNSTVEISTITENIFLEYHQTESKNFKVIENILRQNGFTVEIFPSQFDKTMGFMLARNKRLKKHNK